MQIKNKGYKVWEIIINGYDHLIRKMWTSLRDWGKVSKEERARERNGGGWKKRNKKGKLLYTGNVYPKQRNAN